MKYECNLMRQVFTMLNITRDIHSISDFKRKTPDFVKRLKKTGKPLILTMNGRAQVVVQDAASYQNMLELLEHAKEIEAIREGFVDVEQGNTMSLDEFDKEMRRKHRTLKRR
jgi:prevent-host-death family protein